MFDEGSSNNRARRQSKTRFLLDGSGRTLSNEPDTVLGSILLSEAKESGVSLQPKWELESASGRCITTGRVFEEGEEFYTVFFEEGESFRRADYGLDAWTGPPEGAFCHFKTRVPVKAKKKKLLVNDDLLIGFFLRLSDETEPVRVQFRFVLALILMRKRILRYEGSSVGEAGETWRMRLPREQSEHDVINPHLTDEQIEGVGLELRAIMHGDMGEWEAVAEEVASGQADESTGESAEGADQDDA